MQQDRYKNFLYAKLLLSIEGFGPNRINTLLEKFKSFEAILNASSFDILRTNGFNTELQSKLKNTELTSKITDEAESCFEKAYKHNAKIICIVDSEYPEFLKRIYSPPIYLYMLGEILPEDENAVSIVGTRNNTNYGKHACENITTELVNQGITIISGMARGIDSIAQTTALNSGGRTIAVIGSGIDVIYPWENKNLFHRIKESGAIITEFDPGTQPNAINFPRRNRIISGLSLGTLVIESKRKGGSMQTAEFALEQNKEVFAIPGDLTRKESEGPNFLIQNGFAKLVTNANDILNELRLTNNHSKKKSNSSPPPQLSFFEEKIYNVLTYDPKHIDSIAKDSGLSTAECLSNLLSLELMGLVKQLSGKNFYKN